jgi:hypothetical protein
MSLLKLTEYKDSRVIVIGALEGEYYQLIDFLYDQEFSYKDLLVLTGDFINVAEKDSEKLIQFIRDSNNVFSIKGFNEKLLVDDVESKKEAYLPFRLTQDDVLFLEKLPLVIELSQDVYIVNAGYNPAVRIDKQNPDYTIYKADKLSDSDWFNKEQQAATFCFTHSTLDKTKVAGGYNLGSVTNNLNALILYKDAEPILIKI